MRIYLIIAILITSILTCSSMADERTNLLPPGTQPVYFLSGSPYEMGYQYGIQAAEAIQITRDATRAQALKKYSPEILDSILDTFDDAIKRDLPDYDASGFMQGVADGANRSGCQVSYRDIIMLHNQIALLYYPNITDNGMCTVFTTPGYGTGSPIAGANYDMQNGLAAAYFGTVVAYPSEGIPFISTANAGKLTNSFVMNDNGVLLAVAKSMQISKENKTVYSVNTALSGPAILMHSENASEAAAQMQTTAVPFGLNHLITDKNGDSYVVERIGNRTGVRRPGENGEEGYLIVTNHFLTPVMKEVQKPWDPRIGYPSSYFRYVTAERLIIEEKNGVGIPEAMKILSNTSYYDGNTWTGQAAYSGNTINRFEPFGGTLQSEIADLTNRTLYICSGNPFAPEWNRLAPDQTGEYVKIPLRSSPEATTREIRTAALEQMQKTAIVIGNITTRNQYNGYLLNTWYDEVKKDFWDAEFALINASTVSDTDTKLQVFSRAASGYAKVQAKAQYILRSSGGMPLPAGKQAPSGQEGSEFTGNQAPGEISNKTGGLPVPRSRNPVPER